MNNPLDSPTNTSPTNTNIKHSTNTILTELSLNAPKRKHNPSLLKITEINTEHNTGYRTVIVEQSNQTFFVNNIINGYNLKNRTIQFVEYDVSKFYKIESNLINKDANEIEYKFDGKKSVVLLKKVIRMNDVKGMREEFVFNKNKGKKARKRGKKK